MTYRLVCRDCDAGSTVEDSGIAKDLIRMHEREKGHEVNWWEINGGEGSE